MGMGMEWNGMEMEWNGLWNRMECKVSSSSNGMEME